jgi:O-antigen ligase
VGLNGYVNWASENGEVVHAIHNAYLQVFAENGLMGLVPFMTIVLLAWRHLIRAWRAARRFRHKRDPELHILEMRAVLLEVAFVGALVMGLAQPTNRHKALWLLFVLSTVLVSLVRARVNELVPSLEREEPLWSAPLPGAYDPVPVPLDRPSR